MKNDLIPSTPTEDKDLEWVVKRIALFAIIAGPILSIRIIYKMYS